MNRPLRTRTAALAAGLTLVSTSAAWAAWTSAGTGSGTGKAMSLVAATSPTATTVSPTASAIDIAFTPSSNPAGTTYTVTRDKSKAGVVGAEVACSGLTTSPCHDTGLAASTTFTYTIRAVVQSWSATSSTTPSATTTAAFAITTANVAANHKATFSGTGAAASGQITVVVCSLNSFPCSAGNTQSTVTFNPSSAGAWGPTGQTTGLGNGATNFARATQGASTSPVFTFTS